MDKAFLHMDATGARPANGGNVMLSQFAYQLSRLGYTVQLFDHLDRLNWVLFNWLNLQGDFIAKRNQSIRIVPFGDVLTNPDIPIITGWPRPLINFIGDSKQIDPGRVKVWGGGLLRDTEKESREIFFKMPKIASVNADLDPFYRKIGYEGEIIHLENWIRSDLFRPHPASRREGRIGYQTDNFTYSIHKELVERFGRERIVLCQGSQISVARRMQACDIYVNWNRHFDCFKMCGLQGETFGLSLFEAMACGCVGFSRGHDGIRSHGIIIQSYDLEFLFQNIERYLSDDLLAGNELQKFREAQQSLVRERYRWNDARKDAVRRLLE